MSFRDQVLKPASDSLDNLASALVREVNKVHRDGVDAEGQLGGDLFGFATDKTGKASGMNLVVQDANRVAAAGQFRVIDNHSTAAVRRHELLTKRLNMPDRLDCKAICQLA
jgi:flagellar hook-associated protein FlgK